MSIISFSFSAVARLAVPPGKWFCLARTGLGYSQYSCCVCGMHHEVFSEHWKRNNELEWNEKLEKSVSSTLLQLGYHDHSGGVDRIVEARIHDLVFSKDNFFVSDAFKSLMNANSQDRERIRILTDGPLSLAKLVFPELDNSQVITDKSSLSLSELQKVSSVHVGSNLSDLRVPQTKFLITRKPPPGLVSNIQIFPRLTPDALKQILESV